MTKGIYAIFDRKTKSVDFVKEADNVDSFNRWFATAFLRSDTMFALYPDDYDIYLLGCFDSETMHGDIEPDLLYSVSDLFDIFKLPRPSARPDLARSSDEA